ncbi:nuclear transport factor 2 family protein [Streptosporangium saharense]|uniref:Ketosteroid isomerase-like protein n=1 Tax=Streptosporangium saharense TaxID=1706840 RepID=A0A7W7QN79_9ACTN|nr:nuclear transport factor 2 family protein [Streptosporangium saharense]MBB4916670.1 ketosteroid isomerase-like protein [Streptosporangium saharense]
MNDQNAGLIRNFYAALAHADCDAMERCYHPEVSFGDPVFLELEGRGRVMGMWRMLLSGAGGVAVAVRDVTARRYDGAAHWTASYVFGTTGRQVVNEIDALFRFEDGLIVRHHDEFDFRRWARMALGRPTGLPFGWTPMFRDTIRGRAMQSLEDFMRAG